MSVAEEPSSFCEFSLDPREIACGKNGDLCINDLGDCLTEVLNIPNEQKLTSFIIPSLDNDRTSYASKEHDFEDPRENELGNFTSEKCLSKCATFPYSGRGLSMSSADIFDGNEGCKVELTAEKSAPCSHTQSADSPYSRSISLPTPLKLVSALKGSREKLGTPPRKPTVTWAADVYDPPPTAVSHVPNNKPQRHGNNSKKSGKNKQKGGSKASHGIKGKDKRQSRKHGGSSNRCFKSLDNKGRVACSSGPQVSTVDFDVGSPDPFCGHTFLKKSVRQIHLSVAEAT